MWTGGPIQALTCGFLALTQVSEALGTIGAPSWCSPGSTPLMQDIRHGRGHIETLRKADVDLVYGRDVWPLYEPREGPEVRKLPWPTIMESIQQVAPDTSRRFAV
ncbi:hypothetical protein ABID95_003866 [Streptomyces atratus]